MIQRKETPAFGATLPEKKSAFVISDQRRKSRLSFSIFIFILYVPVALSLHYDPNSDRIIVDFGQNGQPGDMERLQTSANIGRNDISQYDHHFKDAVPRLAAYTSVPMAYHHIIPYNVLRTVIRNSRRQEVEDYVNTPHIRAIIGPRLGRNGIQPANHGKLIHSSIAWNPYNIVRGPDAQHRSDDPGAGLDTQILKLQTYAYQASVKGFYGRQSLERFAEIPRARPVEFVLGNNGRYSAPQLSCWDFALGKLLSVCRIILPTRRK